MGEQALLKNLGPDGLRSIARNNKATRLFTRPWDATKSYARDLTPRMVKLQSADGAPGVSAWAPSAGLLRFRAEAYSYPTTMCGGSIVAFRHGF